MCRGRAGAEGREEKGEEEVELGTRCLQHAAAPLPHGTSFSSPLALTFGHLHSGCDGSERTSTGSWLLSISPSHHEEETAFRSFIPGVGSLVWIMMPERSVHISCQVLKLSLVLGAMAASELFQRSGRDGSP